MGDDRDFVDEWRPFVASIAHKVCAQFGIQGELDDLLAAGMEGLVGARNRFDASRGVKFNTFAYYRVRGAIIDHVRRQAYLPSGSHRLVRAAAADDVLEAEAQIQGASPAKGDAAANLRRADDVLGKLTASFVIASLGQDEAEAVETPEAFVIARTEATRVRQALDELPDRERALVKGFYFEGRRFDEVAAELGISKSWASRIHGKALDLLRRALQEP
ncbi:MAG: sigma-70 family RNA polymerase sigma factor [Deltaproteobacteria bacterium]|nr:sigma-70 family RNA polymerase sigma factor [Deltaproteobacteria bacterium]